MQSHDINRGYCRSVLFISFAMTFSKWSKNGNFEGQMYALPSKNICLGSVLNQYYPCMYIKTEAIHGTLRAP